jgi:hypothetical protein
MDLNSNVSVVFFVLFSLVSNLKFISVWLLSKKLLIFSSSDPTSFNLGLRWFKPDHTGVIG